ncbi:hypothetical protein [Tropicibacter sp. Alg240-R139]|uniref:hypothetical protein n=1 Tax=Tropicibacter sp. Alg240-R139 TaxID=2305991 RepID=UPI0013DEC86A|nr:hypothetical protein [Tropicibacter sp. Alg240-R139]
MAVNDLDKSPFVTVREAFEIVGKATLGDDWHESAFEKDASRHKLVLTRLRNILRSGDVAAHWRTEDHEASGELEPVEVDHEFFSIRLHDDTVFHAGVNEPVQCRIHAKQLERCLLDLDETQPSFTSAEERKCTEWFVDLISNTLQERLKVAETEKLAKDKFDKVSGAGIKRARLSAVEKTGKHDIFRSGRPKINQ